MSKTILVLLNGHAGVGKDTFVAFCRDYANKHNCEVMNLHRSDAPKAALNYLGWDGVKDEETRTILKQMIDYLEQKGLLKKYLENQIASVESISDRDKIIFYHVRDPEIMYSLMEIYVHHESIKPISVLIQRDLPQPQEPTDWWGDLENADYMMSIRLPENDFDRTQYIANDFVNFLLEEDWEIVTREERESWQK